VEFEEPDHLTSIRHAIREICAQFTDDYWREKDSRHEFPWDYYNALASAGWVGIAIPEQYGGGGGGITEASIVAEEVAASGAAMNGASAIHLSIFGMNPVVKYGSPQQRAKYLPEVAAGRLHVAFGVTEPDAGTDTTSITTRAVRDGDHYVVTGQKVWTSKAALRTSVKYATERTVFGRPIGKNQGIAFPLAQAHMKLRAAELIIREASWRYDQGLTCGEQANTAKYLASEAAFFAADRAMQTHGGFAYAREYNVGRYFLESRLMQIAPVPQEMVLNYVAEHVLRLPRSY
jgi:alkylation response protein AidB-like acyl-CoA dehydrogenase